MPCRTWSKRGRAPESTDHVCGRVCVVQPGSSVVQSPITTEGAPPLMSQMMMYSPSSLATNGHVPHGHDALERAITCGRATNIETIHDS